MDPFSLREQQATQLNDVLRWAFSPPPGDSDDDDPFDLAESFTGLPAPSSTPSSVAAEKIPRSDGGAESSHGFRHMMRERQRRERLSQGYADLHAMLPSRSKGDKVSVVQGAGEYLKALQQRREKLRRRIRELKLMMMTVAGDDSMEAAESSATTAAAAINVRIENCSSSSVDSVMAALQCLKKMELRTATLRTVFSGQDLSVEVIVHGDQKHAKKEAMERAMRSALCFDRTTG